MGVSRISHLHFQIDMDQVLLSRGHQERRERLGLHNLQEAQQLIPGALPAVKILECHLPLLKVFRPTARVLDLQLPRTFFFHLR